MCGINDKIYMTEIEVIWYCLTSSLTFLHTNSISPTSGWFSIWFQWTSYHRCMYDRRRVICIDTMRFLAVIASDDATQKFWDFTWSMSTSVEVVVNSFLQTFPASNGKDRIRQIWRGSQVMYSTNGNATLHEIVLHSFSRKIVAYVYTYVPSPIFCDTNCVIKCFLNVRKRFEEFCCSMPIPNKPEIVNLGSNTANFINDVLELLQGKIVARSIVLRITPKMMSELNFVWPMPRNLQLTSSTTQFV